MPPSKIRASATRDLTFWDWLLRSSAELRDHGVRACDVVRLRFEHTGHLRALDRTWAPAFDCWGGVEDVGVIATRTGRTPAQVRQHAKDAGLRFATRNLRRTHAELALLLWSDRTRGPAESCKTFGVPPGARRILCAVAQVLVDAADGGITEVLSWSIAKLEAKFTELRLDLRPPARVLAQTHPPSDGVAGWWTDGRSTC